MSKDIRIKKGLNINLVGAAEQTIANAVASNVYALNLDDFHGITPKMLIKEGEEIKAGEPIFYNKNNEDMHFVSPVSGELVEIVRGARRRILTLKILADKEQQYMINKVPDLDTADGEAIKSYLLQCGGWPFIKQRPYDVIAVNCTTCLVLMKLKSLDLFTTPATFTTFRYTTNLLEN